MARVFSRLALLWWVVLFGCAHARAQPFDPNAVTRRYVALRSGKVVGEQLIADVDPKTLSVRWSYTIDGHGPDLDVGFALGSRSYPVWVESTGHDVMGIPVAERFVQTRREANWSNRGEQGRRRTRGNRFYVSFDPVPEELAMLARALLATPRHTLPLLPEGRASLRRLAEVSLVHAGRSIQARHYAIDGLDFAPVRLWLDADGNLLGRVTSEYTLVRDDWRELAPLLEQHDSTEQRAFNQQWSAELPHRVTTTLAIINADVFDPRTFEVHTKQSLLVEGDRITAVGPTASLRLPVDAQIIDVKRAVVLPGLWDFEASHEPVDRLLYLAAGITSVVTSPGHGEDESLGSTTSNPSPRSTVGPRVHPLPSSYTNLNNRPGSPPRGDGFPSHCASPRARRDDQLAHAGFLRLDTAWPKTAANSKWEAAFCVAGRTGIWPLADLTSDRRRGLLLDLQVPIVLPIVQLESALKNRTRHVSPSYAAVADELPLRPRRALSGGGMAATADDPSRAVRELGHAYDELLDWVATFADDDDTILLPMGGELAGFGLHRTLELLVAAGLSPARVLRAATWDAARIAGRANDLGYLAVGKRADFLVTSSDPLHDISGVRSLELVVHGGRVYRTAELYAAARVGTN